jgi:hypothetical protein
MQADLRVSLKKMLNGWGLVCRQVVEEDVNLFGSPRFCHQHGRKTAACCGGFI